MKAFLKRFWREESGEDLIEYMLLLAFVALASASLFVSAGVNSIWQNSRTQFVNAAAVAGS